MERNRTERNGKDKMIYWLLGLIVVLVSSLCAITWGTSQASIKENRNVNNSQSQEIATLKQQYANIEKRLDQIYEEVKNNK